jgi:hypothetical protein
MSRASALRPAVVLGVGLALAACQSTAPTIAPAASASRGGSARPQTTEPASTQGPAASFIAGDGDLFLDPMEGIDGLASHTATLAWAFDGTAAGQPSTWTETTTFRIGRDPATAELLVERTNVPDRPKRDWLALTAGTEFSSTDDATCSAALPDPDRNPFVEPANQLSALIGGTQTGTETINGIPTEAFAFDGRTMGLVDPVTAAGHAWVTPGDNLLVRYDVEIDGGPEYFGDGITGTLTGRYEIADVGGPVAIDLPAGCPAGLIEGPQPGDATDVVAVPGRTQLTTGLSITKTTALYHDTSIAFGWKPVGVPKTQDDTAVLQFTQGSLEIFVVISKGTAGTQVVETAHRT